MQSNPALRTNPLNTDNLLLWTVYFVPGERKPLHFFIGARVTQWWEHSPPINVAQVQILASTTYVGWVCCCFSPLLLEIFLWRAPFSPLLKNQHFQIPIQQGIRWTKNHSVDVLSLNCYLFIYLFKLNVLNRHTFHEPLSVCINGLWRYC